MSATRGSSPSRRRRQRRPQGVRGPEDPRNLGSGSTPAAAPAGSVYPAEATPWPAHPRTRATAAWDWLSPASFPQPTSVARTSLYRLPEPGTAWLRGPLSPPLSARNEIIQRPPGGRLSTRLRGRRARILNCSVAAATAEATTRRQPSHSAAIFARSTARAASAPAGSAPGSRGDEGGVGEFGCQRPGVPAPPPPLRRAPLAAARRPHPAAAAGSGCALRGAQEPRPTPPRRRLTRLLALHSFSFFALHHLLLFLSSFQNPAPSKLINLSRQGAPSRTSGRSVGRQQLVPGPRARGPNEV